MSEFMHYVLWELKNSLGLVLPAVLMAVSLFLGIHLFLKKKYGREFRFPWRKIVLLLVTVGYATVVLYATFFRGSGYSREWNFHLFRAWREAWNNFSAKNWLNVLLNVAMFAPFGFLLPFLWRRGRRWYVTIPMGFALSLLIETLQFVLMRGICDVDDLIANTLGAAMGYCAGMALLALCGERETRGKQFARYAGALLVPVLAMASVFPVYSLQKFGNLPMAPAYTNNTRNTVWIVDGDLPAGEDTAVIYQTQVYRRSDCDALADALASSVGQEVDLVSYYQEMAYYNLNRGNATVYYYDGSYELSPGYDDSAPWMGAERQAVVDALSAFPVSIPEQAEFSADEEGQYTFLCDRVVDGAVMVDGFLRCQFNEDGSLRKLVNHLVWYTYGQEVQILSPEEALERLQAGKFYDHGYFEYKDPRQVRVISCTAGYEIDTKGFYQPVYRFVVEATDGSYGDTILIPALRT